MPYCTRCILPDTRPHLELDDEGVCNACRTFETRTRIDWEQRAQLFGEVVQNAKRGSIGYDCLIPVSGGKDSTWQVITCLEHGLTPLAVTWRPPGRTAIGQNNLDNLIQLGVDHVDFSINPVTEKKFMLQALERFGSPAIPMHMAIFNIPLKLALAYQVPLIVYGENSAFEYGEKKEEERTGFQLNNYWLEKHGVMHGTSWSDWASESITEKELLPYVGPSIQKLESAGSLAIFLGYYFPWDVETSRSVAMQHGFQCEERGARTGYYDFADIDDDFISIHHYLKWYKFGFTRLFDNLSLEIRHGRLSRAKAIAIVQKSGSQIPRDDIGKFCEFVDISPERFFEIIEKFRNHDIWYREGDIWKIKDFLINDWDWK